jgi:LPXTG-motif cell wall-anchored protein
MHAWVRRALCAVGLTAGIVLLGIGIAEAASADGDNGPVTTGQDGILSGNQTGIDADAPINLSGNQVTVIGQDNHTAATGSSSTSGSGTGAARPTTSGAGGIGSGNQTAADVDAPVNASGNQLTVIGQDNDASGTGSSSTGASGSSTASPTTSGANGIGSGNQTGVDVQAPIDLSGNQVTVIGQDNSVASQSGTSSSGPASGEATTTGEHGLISGNQTGVGLSVPIDLSGNQVTVIGQDNTVTAAGGSTTGSGATGGEETTSGQDGLVSGNQTGVTALAPVAATGNQVTVVGQDDTVGSTGGSTTRGGPPGPGQTTTGEGAVGSGNQTPVVVQAPVDTSGNQVTVVGQGNTVTSAGGSSTGGTGGGTGSTAGGTVVSPPATGGGATSVSQGGTTPGATVLPNTGADADLLALAVLGMLLLSAGLVLGRPRRLTVR